MAPHRRCPTCGSKQWHKEPSSGLIACSEGHVLQNYRDETTEITEVGPHAMKKRTLKSRRKKKEQTNNADPKLYHGARGRYHYFLCLQLIFRKQIAALTKLWDLPPEFEVICRDLWALNLALLPDPPPAEPYDYAQENLNQEDTNLSVNVSRKNFNQESTATEPGVGKKDNDSGHESGEDADHDQDSAEHKSSQKDADYSGEEEEEYEDPELEALMRENSVISDSSDDDSYEEKGIVPDTTKKTRKLNAGKSPHESPASTIAILVLACCMMRIPVMYRDFTRIIESYELPYLEGTMRLPQSMIQHLTKHNMQALSPPHAPKTLRIHALASRLAKKMYAKYGVVIPEANAAIMLWRITKDMGGTPVLYHLTKRVAHGLSVPLTLHWTLSPGLVKIKGGDPSRHRYDNAPPEVGLLASLIIVTKLVYGLDGQARYTEDADDVGCGLVSEKEYLERMDAEIMGMKYNTEKVMQVGDMKPEEIDDYISFCSRILEGKEDETVTEYFGKVVNGRKEDERKQKGSIAGGQG